MKKIFTLSALAFAAMSMNAGVNLTQAEKQVVKEMLPTLSSEVVTTQMAPKADGAVLQDGSKWMLKYQGKNLVSVEGKDTTSTGIGSFEVKMISEDSVHLVGFADGYDLKGKYDKATGILSFRFPQVIGQFSTYGNITARMVKGTSLYTGVWKMKYDENGFTFDNQYGIYGAVSAGWVVWMDLCESASPANGVQTYKNKNNQSFTKYVNAKLDAQRNLVLEGVSMVATGSYTPITLSIDKDKKSITLPDNLIVDRAMGQEGLQEFRFMPLTSRGQLDSKPVVFNYTVSGEKSTLKCANTYGLFLGYPTDNQGNFRGQYVLDYVINLDINIDANTTGVENIAVEENAPVEYFNLQGMKVNSNNLKAGIYVVRQGNKATKVLVK